MPGKWQEITRIRFKGDRFKDHALDLTALGELSQFQKVIAETAKALWKMSHPERQRVPKRFEDRTRLCLRRIDEGSAVAPLEVYIEESVEPEIWEQEPEEVKEAVVLASAVYRAVGEKTPLPDRLPKSLLPEYAKLGQLLEEDETMEIDTPGNERAEVTHRHGEELATLVEGAYSDIVEVQGEVLEVDVKQKRFQLWLDGKTNVPAFFAPEQEADVTTALKEHDEFRVNIKGQAQFSPQGKMLRITEIRQMQIAPKSEPQLDPSARCIEEILKELASEVPAEEWDNLPADLTDHLDHYIYGTDKR